MNRHLLPDFLMLDNQNTPFFYFIDISTCMLHGYKLFLKDILLKAVKFMIMNHLPISSSKVSSTTTAVNKYVFYDNIFI